MKKWYLLAVVFLLMAGVWFWQYSTSDELKIYFFDTSEGDAIFINTPQGYHILVDGGPDRKILRLLAESLPYGDRTIDLVVSTHPHADHLSGLLAVLEEYQVNKILTTGVLHTTNDYEEWLKQIKNKNIPYQIARAGDNIEFSDGVRFEILWPEDDLTGQRAQDLNDTSVVLRVVYGKTAALLTGDIPQTVEQILIQEGNLSAQILKVAHQGSNTSSSKEFLQAVAPTWAVILVGANNRYGHPSSKVLNRLQALGINVLRTDLLGSISFISNGQNWFRKN